VHRADLAVLHRLDADIDEGELLLDGRKVGLVAADTIEGFGDDDVEFVCARGAHHAAELEAIDGTGAGYRLIGEGGDDRQALPFGPGSTKIDLVLAGALVLFLG
jgi:hypothetical protein